MTTEARAGNQAEECNLFLSESSGGSIAKGSRVVSLKPLELVLLLSLAFDIGKMILIYLFSGSSLVAVNFQEHEESARYVVEGV